MGPQQQRCMQHASGGQGKQRSMQAQIPNKQIGGRLLLHLKVAIADLLARRARQPCRRWSRRIPCWPVILVPPEPLRLAAAVLQGGQVRRRGRSGWQGG